MKKVFILSVLLCAGTCNAQLNLNPDNLTGPGNSGSTGLPDHKTPGSNEPSGPRNPAPIWSSINGNCDYLNRAYSVTIRRPGLVNLSMTIIDDSTGAMVFNDYVSQGQNIMGISFSSEVKTYTISIGAEFDKPRNNTVMEYTNDKCSM
ncbi:hypothetical protein BAX95_01220 [Elizabethkingia meningoseptica]|uniref:hypothetical protein n=1 Tax=Elizabethkingia meningoseptica TaxID=238 RepID=UPI00099A17E6|nr:hypothetical protein [Elizabethkingia meningoseptica]EJK5327589.1 hypothetical protein [Elizabethkingia meningoseptica]OPC25560.1 hypothetical protein BAX95_01220 [Elizabethkingia meningoseptica]WBS74819.1 hypothetical protein PF438_18220 [Elizabethkingia meningoseptica]HAY3561761.1 hypothetical protein [Elizabethkingia meningoseptica]